MPTTKKEDITNVEKEALTVDMVTREDEFKEQENEKKELPKDPNVEGEIKDFTLTEELPEKEEKGEEETIEPETETEEEEREEEEEEAGEEEETKEPLTEESLRRTLREEANKETKSVNTSDTSQQIKTINERILKGLVDNPFQTIAEAVEFIVNNNARLKESLYNDFKSIDTKLLQERKNKAQKIYGEVKTELKKEKIDFDKLLPDIEKEKKRLSADELEMMQNSPKAGLKFLARKVASQNKKKRKAGIEAEVVPSGETGRVSADYELSSEEEAVRKAAGMTKEEYIKYKD